MNPNTASFPSSIVTDNILTVLNDNAFSPLSTNLNSTSGIAYFNTPGVFENLPCLIAIDNEIILATGTSGTNGLTCSRGQIGTSAGTHGSGVPGYGYIFGYVANQLSAEIKAIETSLGVSMVKVISSAGTAGGDLSGTYPKPSVATVGGATAANIATAASEAHEQNTDTGTDNSTFQIGSGGPKIKDVGTALEIRNAADSTYTDLHLQNILVYGNLTAGTAGALAAGGDLTGNYPSPTLGTSGVTAAGPIGGSTTVPVITVDAKGRITALTSAVISGATPSGSAGGDLTGNFPNPTLIATGSAGTFGDTTHVPVFITDSKGRVTAVTNTLISFGTAGGDLTGNYPSPSIAYIGGSGTAGVSASQAIAATKLANAATNINTPLTLIERDINGDFLARNITARIIGGGTSGSLSLGTGAGSAGSKTLSGTDMAGNILVTTGSSPATAAPIVTMTFGIPLTNTPSAVILEPSNAAAAALTTATPFISNASTSGFTIESNAVALGGTTTYSWYYLVIG